jgi:4-amino-4-deoxy-L-arabinose transferase-like glycosyltransferase
MVVFLLLSVGSARTRRPWCDEAWFADPAYNLITNGMMGTTILEPAGHYRHPIGIQQHTYWVMPLHILGQAAWYKLVGFSLDSLRALSILFGLLALAAWFQIVYSLTSDRLAAWVVFCFLCVQPTFVETASVGRMDMMSAALGFASLAVYLRLRDHHFSLAIFAGHALVAASLFTHPVGGVLAFVALLVLCLRLDRARTRLFHLSLVGMPYLLAMAGWGIYILQMPSDFVAQFSSNASGRFQDLAVPWTAVRREITERYLANLGFQHNSSILSRLRLLPLIAYLFGCLAASASRGFRARRGHSTLLMLVAAYTLGLMILDGSRQGYYLVYSMAALSVGFSLWIYWLWDARALSRYAVVSAVGLILLLQTALTAYRIVSLNTMRNRYLPAVAFLQRNMSSRMLLMGSAELGFKLGFDANLTDDPTLGYYTGKRADIVVVEDLNYAEEFDSFRRHQPNVYRYINRLLTVDYHCVYDHNFYKIYARR